MKEKENDYLVFADNPIFTTKNECEFCGEEITSWFCFQTRDNKEHFVCADCMYEVFRKFYDEL